MPRRNNQRKVKRPELKTAIPKTKRRYPTQRKAQETADYQMLLNPDLTLKVYQDIDGGWYLTRDKSSY